MEHQRVKVARNEVKCASRVLGQNTEDVEYCPEPRLSSEISVIRASKEKSAVLTIDGHFPPFQESMYTIVPEFEVSMANRTEHKTRGRRPRVLCEVSIRHRN